MAFPTETVYGLGANAFNSLACVKIFEIKQRPFFDPLIVHVAEFTGVEKVAEFENNEMARKLAENFWPGPMTLILKKNQNIPDIVTAGLETVAVRMPDHPVARELIKKSGVPIAAPSANLFGSLSPTKAEHVLKQLGDKVKIILDAGPSRFGVESTIIDLSRGKPLILRFGGLTAEEIEKVIGRVEFSQNQQNNIVAPGQLLKHYSPHTKLLIVDSAKSAMRDFKGKRVGLLSLKKPKNKKDFVAVQILSETGDLKEAAANLFESLDRFDVMNLDLILVEPVPEIGLGRAIMDRLRRASRN